MNYRYKLLKYLQTALYWSGLASLNNLFKPKNGALILMYHSVSSVDDVDWIDPANDIPDYLFEKQIQFINKKCHVISIDELIYSIKNNIALKPRTIVITFDDGYRNNFTVAAKILKKYDLPATLYLATGYVDRGESQWIDELFGYFKQRSQNKITLPELSIVEQDISSIKNERDIYARIKNALLVSSHEERRNILDEINSQLMPSALAPVLTVNWDELKELMVSFPGLTIGAHTKNHIDLTAIDTTSMEQEVCNSIKDIELNLGIKVEHFSYPYGRSNQESQNLINRLGLKSAVATEPSEKTTHKSDLYRLTRVEVPTSTGLFRFITSGSFPELSITLFGRSN